MIPEVIVTALISLGTFHFQQEGKDKEWQRQQAEQQRQWAQQQVEKQYQDRVQLIWDLCENKDICGPAVQFVTPEAAPIPPMPEVAK